MKAIYSAGLLSIDLTDVLENMPAADKVNIIDTLACDSDIIRHVTAQILHGYTEHGSCGYRCTEAYARPTNALDAARRDIAKTSDDIAKREIERLEEALRETTNRLREAQDAMRMRHHSTSEF